MDIRGWDVETGRSVASVTWADGTTNVYRVGHKGKVDLKCVGEAAGGFYYKEHLPRLGRGCLPACPPALAEPVGGPGSFCSRGEGQGGCGLNWAPLPASREASRVEAQGECGQPALPAWGQGDVSAGHRRPEGDAGRPWQVEPQDGRGELPCPLDLCPALLKTSGPPATASTTRPSLSDGGTVHHGSWGCVHAVQP